MNRPQTASIRLLAFAAALSLVVACGGDGGDDECGVGEQCPCTFDQDCPDPLTEQCNAPFGQEGICIPRATGDIGEDPVDDTDTSEDIVEDTDTGEDVAPDTDTDTGEDVVQDTDAADVTDTVDAPDDPEDVTETGDVETGEVSDADVRPDTLDVVDEDTGEIGGYVGWIAFQTVTSETTTRVVLMSEDGAAGPYEMPAATGLGSTSNASFSSDGTQLVYAVGAVSLTSIRVVDLATGTYEDLLSDSDFVGFLAPRFSPDGGRILFAGKTLATLDVWNLYVLDLETGEVTTLTNVTEEELDTRFVSAGAWSHDGNHIYYVTGEPSRPGEINPSDVWRMNADGGNPTKLTVGQNPSSLVLSVRSDGTELLFDSGSGGGPARLMLDGDDYDVEGFGVVGADSSCVYYGETDRVVCSRLQTDDFETCFLGDPDCEADIVVLDLATGDLLRNVTRSVGARDTFPAATPLPYTDLPYTEPDGE